MKFKTTWPVRMEPMEAGEIPAQSMSLRDWLAGMALQGLMVGYADHGMTIPNCVDAALDSADELLSARKEGA